MVASESGAGGARVYPEGRAEGLGRMSEGSAVRGRLLSPMSTSESSLSIEGEVKVVMASGPRWLPERQRLAALVGKRSRSTRAIPAANPSCMQSLIVPGIVSGYHHHHLRVFVGLRHFKPHTSPQFYCAAFYCIYPGNNDGSELHGREEVRTNNPK